MVADDWYIIYAEILKLQHVVFSESPRTNDAMDSQFDRQKIAALSGVDLSRKGSIDAPIEELIHYINSQKHYFTTSSCSGRIIVFDNVRIVSKLIYIWASLREIGLGFATT